MCYNKVMHKALKHELVTCIISHNSLICNIMVSMNTIIIVEVL